MKPVFVPHETYQNFVIDMLQKYYSGGVLTLVNSDWPVINKLWITNILEITNMLYDSYGKKGPLPRDPASMLRSYLLLLFTKPTMSITEWVDELRRVPLMLFLVGLNPAIRLVLVPFTSFLIAYGLGRKRTLPIKRKVKSLEKRNPKKEKREKKLLPQLPVGSSG